MKTLRICIFIILLQFLMVVSITYAEVEFSTELFLELAESINDIPYIETPDYKRIELENGMIVYLAEDKDLPVVEIRGYIKGGISQESPEQAGISSIMSSMMNLGTKNYNEFELSRYKELNGLSFNLLPSYDHYVFSGNSLSIDKEKLIALTAEILRNPEFEADYYNRIIQEFYQLLVQQYYYDSSLLTMFFSTSLYGDHPYGYSDNISLVLSALQEMTADKLERYYQESIDPSNIIMIVCGDFEYDEMEGLIRESFEDWESKGIELKEKEIVVNEGNFNRVILVNKEDATHAKMRMGYNFYNTHFEDKTAFLMANRVFGGDFTSRLMENLRTGQGFVYGIYSSTSYNQQGGLYYVSTDVAPEYAYEIMEAVKREMLAIKEGEKAITEEELFENVNLYNAFFPKSYKTRISVLSELAYGIEVMGKGEDSINDFIKEYNELTAAEVQRVFAEHTYPDRFLTVIVGRKDDILPVFEEKGVGIELIELF